MKAVRRVRDGAGPDPSPTDAAGGCSVHDGLGRLVQLLPRVMRGMRRRGGGGLAAAAGDLEPRHGSALSLLRDGGPATVGQLAAALGLTLATVSGVVSDLERVGFVERLSDPGDRRRTIVACVPGHEDVIDAWLAGATAPIVAVLNRLDALERAAFVKGMELLDAELNTGTGLR